MVSAVESGRSVLACIVDRLDRPLLDDLTEQLVDRAAAMGAAVTHLGRPELAGSRRRRWKRLASALGNPSFLVVPATRIEPDVQVRRLPIQQGDTRTVVGRTTTLKEDAVE